MVGDGSGNLLSVSIVRNNYPKIVPIRRDTETVTPRRIVVVGASSGGIEALTTLVSALPEGFAAPVCVVLHMSPDSPGMLDRILSRAGALEAVTAESGMRLRDGRVFVARPDHHLVIEPGVLRLTKGPKENRFRPAIDPLFRTAAQVYGPNAIGVVLTGSLDDGTAGLWTIKQLGGIAVVQDPADALFASMPESARRHVAVDHVVPLRSMAALLCRLVEAPVIAAGITPDPAVDVEVSIAKGDNAVNAGLELLGDPSPFACPECHGVLLRMKGTQPMRFRCHTGHAYSATSLVAAINGGIEEALWGAVRALEEGALLLQHISDHSYRGSDQRAADDFTEQAAEARRQSEAVRQVAQQRDALRAVES